MTDCRASRDMANTYLTFLCVKSLRGERDNSAHGGSRGPFNGTVNHHPRLDITLQIGYQASLHFVPQFLKIYISDRHLLRSLEDPSAILELYFFARPYCSFVPNAFAGGTNIKGIYLTNQRRSGNEKSRYFIRS